MTIRIIYSENARRLLREIALFVAEHNPSAALRLVVGVERGLEGVLGVFPEAGVRLEGGLRFLTVRKHSVVYRFDPVADEVLVLDVFGPGMDWR